MLDLEPLIAGLVEDILRAIRHASVDELRQLREVQDGAQSRSARAGTPRSGPRERGRRAAPRRTQSTQNARSKRISALPQHAPEPAPMTEITDPEQLLGASTTREASRPASVPPVPVQAEAELPASGTLPATTNGRTLRLREGESLARSAGDGIVIRRSRSA
jgi:hypothetical protein